MLPAAGLSLPHGRGVALAARSWQLMRRASWPAPAPERGRGAGFRRSPTGGVAQVVTEVGSAPRPSRPSGRRRAGDRWWIWPRDDLVRDMTGTLASLCARCHERRSRRPARGAPWMRATTPSATTGVSHPGCPWLRGRVPTCLPSRASTRGRRARGDRPWPGGRPSAQVPPVWRARSPVVV